MEMLYMLSATVGGLLLVVQLVLTLFGADSVGEADIDSDFGSDTDAVDGDAADGFVQISLRTVVAFFTFFGLAGLAAGAEGWSSAPRLAVSAAAGVVAFLIVGFLMRKMQDLGTSGNVDVRNAVGRPAVVYLTVPQTLSGTGAVTVSIQERMLEYRAVTHGPALSTRTPCRVTGLHAGDVLVVEAIEEERIHVQ